MSLRIPLVLLCDTHDCPGWITVQVHTRIASTTNGNRFLEFNELEYHPKGWTFDHYMHAIKCPDCNKASK